MLIHVMNFPLGANYPKKTYSIIGRHESATDFDLLKLTIFFFPYFHLQLHDLRRNSISIFSDNK